MNQVDKYIKAVDGEAHNSAVKIITLLEETIKAQSRLLTAYKMGGRTPEWVFDSLDRARKSGIDV